MKITVTESDFREAFERMGRGDQFTHAGLGALFEYLEDIHNDLGMTGNKYDLDVIGLCCEFAESTLDEIRNDYSDAADMDDSDLLDWLGQQTSWIEVESDRVIYAQF